MGLNTVSAGSPSRLRWFDPVRLADLEYRVWVGYYLRRWPQVLAASVGLVRVGFGMDWIRTLHGAWLVLRANQLWAPFPDNDADGARACMRRFYALVKLSYGEPANPAKAAELRSTGGACTGRASTGRTSTARVSTARVSTTN